MDMFKNFFTEIAFVHLQDLLTEIYAYQNAMDDVRVKGHAQIDRYTATNPGVKNLIEKQLGNVQASYNALLNTALQIKVSSEYIYIIVLHLRKTFTCNSNAWASR